MIERLLPPAPADDVRGLARLLVDAVESGAAVSFRAPLSLGDAEAWWRDTLGGARPRAIFLVARDAEGISGSVQLHPAWAPNQLHRGEIVKLLVHRRARRAGLGTALMNAVEQMAPRFGYQLLTLDAKRGVPAEALYRRLGWTEVGAVPRYALDSDGAPHDAVFFYKDLGAGTVFDLQPTLTGTLLEMRPLHPDDWEALFLAASDPLIWEQHPDRERYREERFRVVFREGLESGGALVAVDRSTGRVIGFTRYHDYRPGKQIEIGWTFLARSHWGGRFNAEMKDLMIRHAFRFVPTVEFSAGVNNLRSRRAIEKLGAVPAGTEKDSRGGDSAVYHLTPETYRGHGN